MANINLYEAYNNKRRKFGVNDSDRYRASFVEAVNLTFAEFNDQVFQSQKLDYIDYFNDVIDTRLVSFDTMTFDVGADVAIEGREYWALEWELERTSATNGITETITDNASNVVLSITNGVFSIAGSTLGASATLPVSQLYSIRFESYEQGNRLIVNGGEYPLTYTTGDAETTQAIGTVSAHVISGVSGFEVKSTRFLTAGTVVYDFPLEEETTDTNVTDLVAQYTALLAVPQWDDRWIEPSSGLDSRFLSPFSMAIDFHIQDGGEWGLESDEERERKWYGRGIKQARHTWQQLTPYTNPLGI